MPNVIEVIRTLGRPYFYYPALAQLFGDVKTSVFVCLFLHHDKQDPEGWIIKGQSQINKETGLSRFEQESARKRLKEMGILEEQLRSMPAKMHYRFKWEVLSDIIEKVIAGQPIQKDEENKAQANPEQPKPPSLIFRLKQLFDAAYERQFPGTSYIWQKDQRGGRDWKAMKDLAGYLKQRLVQRHKAAGSNEVPGDDDVVNSFELMLRMLPKYHLENNLAPHLLKLNFNKILTDIQQEQNKGEKKPGNGFTEY